MRIKLATEYGATEYGAMEFTLDEFTMNGIIRILVVEQKTAVSRQLKQGFNRDYHIVFMVTGISIEVDSLKFVF